MGRLRGHLGDHPIPDEAAHCLDQVLHREALILDRQAHRRRDQDFLLVDCHSWGPCGACRHREWDRHLAIHHPQEGILHRLR